MGTDDLGLAGSGFAETVRSLFGGSVEEGRAWYRALSADGSLWCETSNPDEVVESVAGRDGFVLERLPTYIVRTPWERWEPA